MNMIGTQKILAFCKKMTKLEVRFALYPISVPVILTNVTGFRDHFLSSWNMYLKTFNSFKFIVLPFYQRIVSKNAIQVDLPVEIISPFDNLDCVIDLYDLVRFGFGLTLGTFQMAREQIFRHWEKVLLLCSVQAGVLT